MEATRIELAVHGWESDDGQPEQPPLTFEIASLLRGFSFSRWAVANIFFINRISNLQILTFSG
ncbi:hypothetical protein CAP36_00120 [Chitinophagaceae bacterium IBVUCB2]|nr:hypothetical protein CAP36_00120 [Chitinophagaceae bacterium IBVUCB2]